MRRIYILIAIIVAAVVLFNTYYYYDVYEQQIQFHKSTLQKQVTGCTKEINLTSVDFENEINYTLSAEDVDELFKQKTRAVEVTRKIGLFFSKYHNYISDLSVVDTEGNIFSLNKDSVNYLKPNFSVNRNLGKLDSNFTIVASQGMYYYIVPIYKVIPHADNDAVADTSTNESSDILYGNMVVTLDFINYANSLFEKFELETSGWQWLVDSTEFIVTSNFQDVSLQSNDIKHITDIMQHNEVLFFTHDLNQDGFNKSVMSAFQAIHIMNRDYGIVFTLNTDSVTSVVVKKIAVLSFITFIILIIILVTIMYLNRLQIKERRRLQLSHERFTTVMDSLDACIYATDPQSDEIIFTNLAMSNIFGVREGQKCYEAICKTDKRCENCPYPSKTTEGINEIEHDGQWYEVLHKTIQWVDERVVYLNIYNNITVRKLSQEKLLESEQAFKQIFEHSPIGIVILNHDHHLFQLNQHSRKMFGITNEGELKTQPFEKALSLKRYFSREGSAEQDTDKYLFVTKAGKEIIVYRQEVPVVLQKTEHYLQSYIDITLIEQARKVEAQANKAKSMFLANMSHEIRTPLNGVIGMADAMINSPLTPEQKDNVTIIRKSADLLLSIISDILDFSKIEAGKMTLEEIPFRLREEVNFSVEPFKFKAKEKGIAVSVFIEDEVPDKLIGDPFRLRQIITNLINNAVKFTEEGEIEVTVEFVRDYFGTVILLFSVEDTGIGIPKEKQATVFGSFSQADSTTTRKYGGTGLGTAIAKQLVEMMEGEIWIESPGTLSKNPKFAGSKFSFTAEFLSDQPLDKTIDFKNVKSISQLKTLVIDDRKNAHNTVYENLKKAGAPVEIVYSGPEALLLLRKQFIPARRYKMIFIENTPDFDAFDIARQIDEFDFSLNYVIAILSSNDKPGNYGQSKRMRVDYYMVKPYEPSEIFRIIRESFPNLVFENQETVQKESLPASLSILVAEDNLINQKVAKTIFKAIGYEIDIAENGFEAINKVQQREYDIVFMDFMMPVKDGLEATAELRQMGYKLPIVAMTASATEEDRDKALASGMNDYITKPVVIASIKNVLTKYFINN